MADTGTETEAPQAAPSAAAPAPAAEVAVDDPLLADLRRDLATVAFVAGTDASAAFDELLDRTRRLVAVKLVFEAARGADVAPIVVIAGGTNVGKSTTFNWIVGEAAASSSPLARHTKAPTVYVHTEQVAGLAHGAFLPSYQRIPLDDLLGPTAEAAVRSYFLLEHQREDVGGVVLIDSPDIDSTHEGNRAVAEDLLFLADAVLFVATPEKYNDQLCVTYLRQAAGLGKALTCILNKGADEDVARDFREVVVPGLEAAAEVAVLTLPYVMPRPDPASGEAFREELRGAALRSGDGARALRAAARRGAEGQVAGQLEELSSRLREELSELDRIRSEVELTLDKHRDAYEAFLNGLEFYELDVVFERVMQYFKIPVLDHVYDGFRSAVGFVSSNLTRLVSGRRGEDSRHGKLQVRAEEDRQKVKELLQAVRAECLELPYLHAGTLREAVPRWVRDLDSPSVEALNERVEVFSGRAQAEAERWIEEHTAKHVALLEEHPYARTALRTVKGVFQVGFGLLSAKLTGGLGPWDLLIGTATERATKVILESVGGYVHYQTLKTEFCRTRADLFREAAAEAVKAPLLARLPSGVDPAVLDRLGAAAIGLREGRS